ncbi:ROK family protein [Candidatus Caldatribacterium saccharofermentans]|uniref:ROK family transcriptional regulator n=1 Tax=Candidatus Caldatribacterium saccharofermentans TaxID=1454753 RepID=A0A7V4TI71_9BACT
MEKESAMPKNTWVGDNLTDVKIKNRSLVLQLLKKRGPLSRIELARITGLTQPTITNIINDLLASNLVREIGPSETRTGRKPILLSVNDQAFYIIAITFTRQGFSIALTDLGPNILFRRDSRYSLLEDTDTALLELQKEFIHVLEYATQSLSLILGIGVSAPGPVDTETCTILAHSTFLLHRSLDLRKYLREYDLPIFMMSNADAACLHETWCGSAKEVQNMVYFMVGEDVGAGVLIDGKIYQGKHRKAGEVGHTSINIFGPRCVCGNYGCLELYCSTQKIVEKAREIGWFGGEPYFRSFLERGEQLTFRHIVEGAQKDNEACVQLLTQLGRYIGVGVVNLINLYDPELVVIGGEASLAREFIDRPIRQVLEERLLYREYITPQLLYSRWGEDVTLLGAASLVLDHFMAGELGRF